MKDVSLLGIEQIFTSYDNPKGNTETERMMRTIKEEVIWLIEFTSLEEAKEVIGQWIEEDYNQFYPILNWGINLLESLRNNTMNFKERVSHDLILLEGKICLDLWIALH